MTKLMEGQREREVCVREREREREGEGEREGGRGGGGERERERERFTHLPGLSSSDESLQNNGCLAKPLVLSPSNHSTDTSLYTNSCSCTTHRQSKAKKTERGRNG